MVDIAGYSGPVSPGVTVAGKIACKCGHTGSAVWEAAGRAVPARPLVPIDVSAGFYLRIQKKNAAGVEIACAGCGRAVWKI